MMLDIQQKRKFRNVIYHKYTILALFALMLVFLHSTWRVYQKKSESLVMKESSNSRLNSLEQREREIDSKIDKLATPAGVEEEIRSKFSVAKDRENMVIIVHEEATTVEKTTQGKSFWGKFKDLFSKRN